MTVSFIEVQGFRSSTNAFLVKELAILKENSSCSFLFEPPFPESELSNKARSANRYCTKYIHGFDWNHGDVPYEQLEDIVRNNCLDSEKVICKGSEKAAFLKKIIGKEVIDFDEILLKKMEQLTTSSVIECPYNHHGFRCAIENAYKLYEWYKKNKKCIDYYSFK